MKIKEVHDVINFVTFKQFHSALTAEDSFSDWKGILVLGK